MKSTRSFSHFVFSLSTAIALALAAPLFAQSVTDSNTVNSPATSALPPSQQKSVQVMVELKDAPAAVTWAAALKQAQAQADAQRNYALQHPTLRTSQALLKATPQRVQISSASAKQVMSVAQKNDQTQRNLLPALTGGAISGKVIFRTQMTYNGIAMIVSPDKIAQIAAMPGVKAVHPMNPKYPTAAFSDIDFLGVRGAWTKDGLAGNSGTGVVVADIDTGLDYYHTDFGGTGTYPSCNHDGSGNCFSGTVKAPIGYDFAGDAYNADTNPVPTPDNDPFDCGGHGTATASLIAGYGVRSDGTTYPGNWDGSNPNMANLKCSPGLAPQAQLCPLRVFGCAGSTNLVTDALEWVMAYNLNQAVAGYPSTPHNPPFIHVVNMSLGSNEGFADDGDDVAASNLASTGVIICSAAGNAGDSYYIHSSPAAAPGTLSCAATFNDQGGYIYDSNVTGITPPAIAGMKFFSIKGDHSAPIPAGGVSGNLVHAVPFIGNNGAGLSNAAAVNGNICVIDRGTFSFTSKVQDALNAGASAVIVTNATCNPNCSVPILMSTTGQPTGIDVMISDNDYNTISAAAGGFNATTGLPANPTSASINNDGGAQVIPALAVPDTIPTYSSRGPRLPDSATKPDIAAPAEVVGVAQPFTGNGIENFNGTSSATPHVAGEMALLRQLHPTWSVQELMALACNTATHDLFTTTSHTTQYGVGRIGAGRIDVTNAANANVVAFNGTDSNLLGVSFGVVEVPVTGTTTLTKNITVENKGATNVTYNTSVVNNPAVTGATFTVSPSSFTVNAGTTTTATVTFTGTGSSLKHVREASVAATQGSPRQWLTEAGGYAVFTPTDSSPTLRVELYAAPKPASAMHSTITNFVPNAQNGSFSIGLSGAPVNTGSNLGNGFDILSLVKAYELQYANTTSTTDRNVIKYVGVTSDYANRAVGSNVNTQTAGTNIMFGTEKYGDAPTPDFASSDTEIFIDTNLDGFFDYAVFLTNTGTGSENVFVPEIVNLSTSAGALRFFTNGLSAATADTNIYNNSGVAFPIRATDIGLLGAAGTGNTLFQYIIVTFDRNGNEVDESPLLTYDLAHPGLQVDTGLEPLWYSDLTTTSIPVTWNGTNFQNNGSIGVWLFHAHNSDGNRSDVVNFLKPTISGFSPSHGSAGTLVTITGTNFNSGTQVTFSPNNPAASVNVITSNTLVAKVPAGAATGPIFVSNAAGANASSSNFHVP
jgi:subtilisin family serine protease